MPNWCDTTYRVVGDKEQVKRFYDLATKAWNESDGWLGYFVNELGCDWHNVYCRGWMQDEPQLNPDYTECTIFCHTAWAELSGWRHFIEQQLDGLFIYYTAIDPGCGVYCSNDDYYDDKYYVDYSADQPDNPYMTEHELIDFMLDRLGVELSSGDECIEYANRYTNDPNNENEWLFINEMETAE